VPDGRAYEYRWRVDGSWWSDWSRDETALVSRRSFVFQGWHVLEVQARQAGRPETADPTPATLDLLVDGLGPEVEVAGEDGGVQIEATDLVSPPEMLEVTWSPAGRDDWRPVGRPLGIDAAEVEGETDIDIRVVDEAGNATTETFSIRGKPPLPDDTSTCGTCASIGSGRGERTGVIVAIAIALVGLGLGVRRRQR